MVFSVNQPISQPTIIKTPTQQPLPTNLISYIFFQHKPMFQGIVTTSKCGNCSK